MDPFDINIRLLLMFDEVYRGRSVSKAAERLDISQPSLSLGLNKLRSHFGDPLFVRTTRGMEPTPYAEQLITPIRGAIDLLTHVLGTRPVFDPTTSDRKFRICITDITQMVVLPILLERVKNEAPNVSISVLPITDETLRLLESGEVDLVVGYVPHVGQGLYQQRLLMRDYVCIASSRHPRIHKTLTLEAFKAEPHIVVAASGSGLRLAEETLSGMKFKRRVLLEVPHLIGLDRLVGNSDMIATVPRPVGLFLAAAGVVKVYEHPVKLPGYLVKMHWHERYHLDAAGQWMRRVMSEIMSPTSRLIDAPSD